MKKRFKFRCWQCDRIYSLYREVNLEQKMLVACPFCDAEAVVDFTPKKPTEVFRGGNFGEGEAGVQLPDILPTRKP